MYSIVNIINSKLFRKKETLDKLKYNEEGYYIHNESLKQYKVSIIIPCFNSEATISKTIESIIKQTIGFDSIEVLVIDDKSEDNTRKMLLDYAKIYSNIVPIFLEENSGSPSKPRNLGIKLANGKYITFLDSDDWLHDNGIKVLYDLLEKTNDNYAVGKTLKVTDKGKFIIGEYNSWATRESIDPLSISKIFHHLGPTGRMMRTDFLREKNIKFPDMKFAEDKHFFIDVITQCETISTSKEVIYYANRLKDNKSFTTTTTIFEKTDTNIALINYVKSKKLPTETEKMILNRIYEFDCITRLFDRGHFLKSQEKDKYFAKFSEVLSTTESLSYDFTENLIEPWHKTLVDLFKNKRYDDIVTLIEWSKKRTIKEYQIVDGLPYYRIPLNDIAMPRINMLAVHHKSYLDFELNTLILQFKVYGDFIFELESLIIRQRDNEINELEFPIDAKNENLFETRIRIDKLKELDNASHAVFIKYHNYKKIPIKMNVRNIVNYQKRKIDFYTTIADNFGVNIK